MDKIKMERDAMEQRERERLVVGEWKIVGRETEKERQRESVCERGRRGGGGRTSPVFPGVPRGAASRRSELDQS